MPETPLFPLPLVAFEQYMFEDDRPDYPASFFLRFAFSGVFQRPAFHAAAEAALRRHPLLRAQVRTADGTRPEWIPAPRPGPQVIWTDDGDRGVSATGPRIDLRRETGLRIFLARHAGQTEMTLQLHHACCDGVGAIQFAEDLLRAYHNTIADSSQRVCLPPLDPQRLRIRGRFGMNPLSYLLRVPKELVGILGLIEYFLLHPMALQSRTAGPPCDPTGQPRPAHSAHTFTVSETQRLRQAAGRIGCTVNDLLLRDLVLAVREWILQHDPNHCTGLVRVMIPVNLRTAADAVMPAANVVGMVYNDRRLSRLPSPQRLMSILRFEMGFCKRWRLALTMLHVLRLVSKFRGGLSRLLRPGRCLATLAFSNLGDLAGRTALPERDGRIVAANMTLERVELLTPLRPMTHASFGAVSYAGQLTVTLTHDARHLSQEGGCQLLDGFLRRIRSSFDGADQAPREEGAAPWRPARSTCPSP